MKINFHQLNHEISTFINSFYLFFVFRIDSHNFSVLNWEKKYMKVNG